MIGEFLENTLRAAVPLGLSYVFALMIGLERGAAARRVGLRTFPLLSLGACAYVLVAQKAFPIGSDAGSRVVQGLMTGIGFVGGGAILKRGTEIHGLASAASLWNAGAVGFACAIEHYGIAVLLALANLITLHLFVPAGNESHHRD